MITPIFDKESKGVERKEARLRATTMALLLNFRI
jgi:hypothetical protein